MKKNLKRKAIIGGSLSLSAFLFACGGGGGGGDTTTGTVTSPYATVTGTVTTSSPSAAGIVSSTGIQLNDGTILSYIAAVAIDNGKLVYTADDIDDNGKFDLNLKTGLEYAFILFDQNRLPVISTATGTQNVVNVNGSGSITISLSDTDGDGKPDSVALSASGSVSPATNPEYVDSPDDPDPYPENIEVDYGGTAHPDYDEDGDGYFDGIEDNDNDGYIDGKEDSNSNGIPDVYEDDDNDGVPNYLDDSDGDSYPDHIDEYDDDNYQYEWYGTISNIDPTAGTFEFSYNGNTYTVTTDANTQCEINDRYYYGADCFNYLKENMYVELKIRDNGQGGWYAVKVEYKDSYSNDYYQYEVYGTISNIDPVNYTFEFSYNGNTYTVTTDANTQCEINDRYYYGADCFNYLKDGMYVELKAADTGQGSWYAVKVESKSDYSDNYYYRYEIYGTVSNIDTANSTFEFTYNSRTYTVNVHPYTKCEFYESYYYGAECLSYLSTGMYIELKTPSDIYNSTELDATEFEPKDVEIYATVTNVVSADSYIEFRWGGNTYTGYITGNTKCEINDRYYYGADCFNYLQTNQCLEIETYDNIYSGTVQEITIKELETSDDCRY